MMVWEMKFYVLFEQNPKERKVGKKQLKSHEALHSAVSIFSIFDDQVQDIEASLYFVQLFTVGCTWNIIKSFNMILKPFGLEMNHNG